MISWLVVWLFGQCRINLSEATVAHLEMPNYLWTSHSVAGLQPDLI